MSIYQDSENLLIDSPFIARLLSAAEEAQEIPTLKGKHLLLGMIDSRDRGNSLLDALCESVGGDLRKLRLNVANLDSAPESIGAQAILTAANHLALKGNTEISERHLLSALLRDPQVTSALAVFGITTDLADLLASEAPQSTLCAKVRENISKPNRIDISLSKSDCNLQVARTCIVSGYEAMLDGKQCTAKVSPTKELADEYAKQLEHWIKNLEPQSPWSSSSSEQWGINYIPRLERKATAHEAERGHITIIGRPLSDPHGIPIAVLFSEHDGVSGRSVLCDLKGQEIVSENDGW